MCSAWESGVSTFLAQHRDCQFDSDCTVVGACSAGFGFRAVARSAADEAQAMSDMTPAVCGAYDGPLYEGICKRANHGEHGVCTAQETGQACGQAPREPAICDGSSDIRLGFKIEGGFVDSSYFFTYPYGFDFLVIDGKCRVYAGRNYMRGMTVAEATPEAASLIAEQLQYGRIKAWTGRYGVVCPDGGTTTLASPDGAVSCTCGCEGAPGGAATAINSLPELVQRWTKGGGSPGQGVSALIYLANESLSNDKIETWPLTRAIASIPNLLSADRSSMATGAAFEPGADADALRSLRASAFQANMQSGFIRVRESGSSMIYELFVRDDMPTDVAARVKAFFTKAQQR